MTDLLSMVTPSASQATESNRSVTDTTFQEVFNSIQDTTTEMAAKSTGPGTKKNSDNSNKSATSEPAANTESSSNNVTDSGREDSSYESASVSSNETAQADSESSSSADSTSALVAAKAAELAATDPYAYQQMLSSLDNMSMKDLFTALGMSAEEINSLSEKIDLTAPVSEEMKTALVSGDAAKIASALTTLTELPVAETIAVSSNEQVSQAASDASQKNSEVSRTDYSAAKSSDSTTENKTAVAQEPASQESSLSNSSADNSGSQSSLNANSQNAAPAATLNTKTENLVVAQGIETANAAQAAQTASPNAQAEAAKPNLTVVNSKSAVDGASTAGSTNSATAKGDSAATQTRATTESTRQLLERSVMSQIVDKARIIVRPNGTSNMTMRMDPPNLGKVDMRLEVTDNSVKAVFVAESREVKSIIESNLENLKTSLNQSGIKVDEISVTTADDRGFQFRNENQAQNAGSGNTRRQGNGRGGFSDAGHEGDAPESNGHAALRHNGILDVVA
ncbi:MAG: flagellar hook-length control protein FliK [Nitrospinae bacterium]|nr:flagellar hook-length control protein FliK [Nitrospinota bacterium]